MISEDIYNQVAPVAHASGVPDYVWKSIVLMESGGNPKSENVTDKEASYGLFQLNTRGGQGAAYASNPEKLFDPKLNAEIGIPAIARAYRQAKNQDIEDGPDLAAWVAAHSGHPGYNVPLDDYRIKRVKALASWSVDSASGSVGSVASEVKDKTESAVDKAKETIAKFNESVETLKNPDSWKQTGETILVVMVGIVLILMGLNLVVKG